MYDKKEIDKRLMNKAGLTSFIYRVIDSDTNRENTPQITFS